MVYEIELERRLLQSPCSIYNNALVDLASDMAEKREVASRLPTFPSLKSSLYQACQSRLPILPQHREDVHTVGIWEKKLSGGCL